ncbi:Autophagy-related protein [Rhynchospora pubera]|uniref:Autophagy-related protein n=1 Tax=Rhynchospora pubera TaxID=906938 RepID=A0AAV8CGC7_9POAL|nr:Autophagy-related protein [Rhynchospora pubera]KAJ4764239.1 Autophagy-related protein [Rhynchospora pubera]KAJ4816945.1 Autophagy-related protein [Rhynchospora pubera]
MPPPSPPSPPVRLIRLIMAKGNLSFSFALVFFVFLHSLISFRAGKASLCEFSVTHQNTLYNYSLASPSSKFPHGVLSEDGFYKVEMNGTVLWFQLCSNMIFNHDQPACFGCQDCGSPSRCGITCSALVSNNIGGYDVCSAVGKASNSHISLIDENEPKKGVSVKMVSSGAKSNCSLSVAIFCDSSVVRVPASFNLSGDCNYATELTHPSGCAMSIAVGGNGLGWFGTLLLIVICVLGGYILVGTVYRFFFLGIHSIEAIPNLEFWISLPERIKGLFGSLMRRFGGHGGGSRAAYAPIN